MKAAVIHSFDSPPNYGEFAEQTRHNAFICEECIVIFNLGRTHHF